MPDPDHQGRAGNKGGGRQITSSNTWGEEGRETSEEDEAAFTDLIFNVENTKAQKEQQQLLVIYCPLCVWRSPRSKPSDHR